MSSNRYPNFSIFVLVAYDHGSVILRWHCSTLSYFHFWGWCHVCKKWICLKWLARGKAPESDVYKCLVTSVTNVHWFTECTRNGYGEGIFKLMYGLLYFWATGGLHVDKIVLGIRQTYYTHDVKFYPTEQFNSKFVHTCILWLNVDVYVHVHYDQVPTNNMHDSSSLYIIVWLVFSSFIYCYVVWHSTYFAHCVKVISLMHWCICCHRI